MFLNKRSDRLQKKIVHQGAVKKFGNAELSYSCGYPVLKLHGSYYRMGLQYGVLMRDEIRALYGKNQKIKTEIHNVLPWYLRPAAGFVTALVAGYSLFRMPLKYRKELTGLSRGSGVPFIDMASTAFGGVVFDAACTSLLSPCASGIIHSQNLDFEPAYLGEHPVIVEYNHKRKLRYMHLGIAGIPGIFHGMNEKGISVTINYGDGTYNAMNKGLPMGYKLREILERAGTLDDVERILHEKGPDELGWIMTVASTGENSGEFFDTYNGEIVRTPFAGDKTEFTLNNIFAPERTGSTELSKKYLQVSRAEGIYNLARQSRIKKYLEEKTIDSVDTMIDFMRDYNFYGYGSFCGSMNATIVNERTLHTVIFDYQDRAVYFSSAEGYSSLDRIVRYDFNTGRIAPYRDASPEFGSSQMMEFMDWYCAYQDAVIISTVAEGVSRRFRFIRFREYDFSDIVKNCPASSCRNPREIWSLYRIWKRSRHSVNPDDIIISCDTMINRYPEFAILYIIKGNIEKSLKRINNALATYEKALDCPIISGYDRIHILNDLTHLCSRAGMKDKAAKYAEMNVELIGSLTEKYAPGDKVRAILKKMKSHLDDAGNTGTACDKSI